MKLTEILKDVTRISPDDEQLNSKNYLRSLKYIDNLYNFVNILSTVKEAKNAKFLPTFKDCYIAEELGEATLTEEAELRLIKVQCPSFVEDDIFAKLYDCMTYQLCQNVSRDGTTVTFYLK